MLLTDIKQSNGGRSFGLPGGHMDHGEEPDQTMIRELREELGVTVQDLARADFFMHPNGKVVLGYTARLSRDALLVSQEPEREEGIWVTRADLAAVALNDAYRSHVDQHWPSSD